MSLNDRERAGAFRAFFPTIVAVTLPQETTQRPNT